MPFAFYDDKIDKVSMMRSDACAWGVSLEGCVVVTSAIWNADVNNTVTVPENYYGAATPNMSDGPAGPADTPLLLEPLFGGTPGAINKRFNFNVDVHIHLDAVMQPSGEDGIRKVLPKQIEAETLFVQLVFIYGYIVQPGALVALDTDGSVPLSDNGDPIVDISLIVTGDDVLFPPPSD